MGGLRPQMNFWMRLSVGCDPDPRLGTAWEKGERLAKLVAHRRTLLVLDGLEPLQSIRLTNYTVGVLVSRHRPKLIVNTERRKTPAAGILFPNAMWRANVRQHAITRATGQRYAGRCAGRIRTIGWSAVLLSAQSAAEELDAH